MSRKQETKRGGLGTAVASALLLVCLFAPGSERDTHALHTHSHTEITHTRKPQELWFTCCLFQAVTFLDLNELMSVSHALPLGTIAFLLDVEQLFVRVDQGWQEIVVSTYL